MADIKMLGILSRVAAAQSFVCVSAQVAAMLT